MKQAISVLRDRVSLYIFMSSNLGFRATFFHHVDCEFSQRFLWDKHINHDNQETGRGTANLKVAFLASCHFVPNMMFQVPIQGLDIPRAGYK